jgi:primary-amine oxidase
MGMDSSATMPQLRAGIPHPLEPLTETEIASAVKIVREERQLPASVRFVSVSLHEPPKPFVLAYEPGMPFFREAFLILLDNADGCCYEAVVSVTESRVVSWKLIPGVQPSIMLDEFEECEKAVKADPEFQAALAKRGITDMSLVMVDPWSSGHFGSEEESSKRLSRTLSWVRSGPDDNGYAHPIEGVIAVVDLNKMEVIRVEDYGGVPYAFKDYNYTVDRVGPLRSDLRPLSITQPEGPSFTVDGHQISWQKWKFRFSFNPREGLVLHTITYNDGGKERPLLYRASLSEMVVPYGDPGPTQNTKNAFDAGEYGIGMLANSLEYGCDCVGYIRYFDAVMTNSRGEMMKIKNAVCLHEEDYGILWKHTDWRTNDVEVRRSRRLVISSISTVANYEYGFFWYFYQDGTISFEVKLTGILSTGGADSANPPRYGAMIGPHLYAPNHQHFFNIRLDLNIDGTNNSVYEVNTVAAPKDENNPYGNAFFAESTLLATEKQARRQLDLQSARYWKFVNDNVKNEFGGSVGYKLVSGENCLPFASPDSSLMNRAGFIGNHLWATPYSADERHASGNYPNQHPGGDGLPSWTEADRPISNTDLVVWYTMGHHHIPRPEDWPVMPTAYIGFSLKPTGFFNSNPALDVPPNKSKRDTETSSCCSH